jgi:hypothetical protein
MRHPLQLFQANETVVEVCPVQARLEGGSQAVRAVVGLESLLLMADGPEKPKQNGNNSSKLKMVVFIM